jgi:hypothetical protein
LFAVGAAVVSTHGDADGEAGKGEAGQGMTGGVADI